MKTLRLLLVMLGVFVLAGCPKTPVVEGLPAVLTIHVVNGVSNQPVAGARVSLKKDSQPIGADVPTDDSGTAVYNVTTGDGYKAFAGNANGLAPAASPSIKLEGNQEVVIRMLPSVNGGGLIAGSVKNAATQEPLSGVTVTLGSGGALLSQQRAPAYQGPVYAQQRAPRPFGVLQAANSVQTDASGQFTFSDVPAGAYKVTYQLAGFGSTSRDVTVIAGDSTAIETVFLGNGSTPNPNPNPTSGPVTPATGHVLMVDAGRAVELDGRAQIVWRYLSGGISSATRLPDGNTVVADEQNHKVWLVGVTGDVLWDMGLSVGLFSRLNAPTWIGAARDGKSFLITDTGNNQVTEIENRAATGWHFDGLNRPRSATYVPGTGNVLIADTGNNRVIEVDRTGQIVWKFDRDMQAPVHAVRLETGNTLITDAGYNRVIMINPQGQSVWYYDGAGTGPLNRPRSAMPTRYNTYLIADTGNNRIIEVDRSKTIVSSIPNVTRPQVLERL